MSDDELVIHARNREALCPYAWHPCLYHPQLKNWLGLIRVPTLVLWGESDRIVRPEYGRAYAGLIPGARFARSPLPATIPRSSSRRFSRSRFSLSCKTSGPRILDGTGGCGESAATLVASL